MARASHHQGTGLVQRRPARRQPGPDRADGRGAQAAPVRHLVTIGFKEIEVGFPRGVPDRLRLHPRADRERPDPRRRHHPGADPVARSPDRAAPSRRWYAAPSGRSSTSTTPPPTLQRRVVFGLDRAGIIDIAVEGARLISELAEAQTETEVVYQYSPESFTGTELDFAREICEAVMEVWEPTPDKRAIVNLPATVEMATPNVYADQIEWFHRNVGGATAIILSPAPAQRPRHRRGRHRAGGDGRGGPDRGHAVRQRRAHRQRRHGDAGAQPVHPGRRSRSWTSATSTRSVRTAEYCTQLPVHPRHPYAGELVYTAFSGSHQDAIKKGLAALRKANAASSGRCRTCRSTRPMSGAPTRR